MGVLDNIAIGIHMLWSRLKVRAPFIRALKSVEKTQADVLMRILRDNKKTEFGKKYGLSEISSVSEFRNQVPIHDYDDLEPYIKRQQEVEHISRQRNDHNGQDRYHADCH